MSYENGMWSNAAGDSSIRNPCHPYWYRKVPNQHLRRRGLLLLNGSLHPKSWQLLDLAQLGLYGDFGKQMKGFQDGRGTQKGEIHHYHGFAMT